MCNLYNNLLLDIALDVILCGDGGVWGFMCAGVCV